MHTKKALVRIILRRGSFFPFSQKIKRKHKHEKEGQDIHTFKFLLPSGANKLIFLIFHEMITQSTAIVKTKNEVFIKNID